MAGFLLLILCLNIDALSFGIKYGLQNKKFTIIFIIKLSILSTIFFAIPLFLSRYIFKYFERNICNLINGIVLILFGIISFFKKDKKDDKESLHFSRKRFFIECLVFSVDAIFSALLGGFNPEYYILFVIFYLFSNFLFIFLGNFLIYKISSKIKFRVDYLGGLVFITLGFLKIFGI